MDNHLFSRAFSLYAELLQLHGQGERLSDWLAGAAYRIRQLERPVTDMSLQELAEQFRPEIIEIIKEGKKTRQHCGTGRVDPADPFRTLRYDADQGFGRP